MCLPVYWSCHVGFIEGQLGATSVRMNCTAQYSDVMYFGIGTPACWPSSRRRIDRVRYRQLCTSANQGTNRLGWYYLILGRSSKAGLAGNAIETNNKHSGPTRILQGLKPRGSSVTQILGISNCEHQPWLRMGRFEFRKAYHDLEIATTNWHKRST